MWNFYRYCLFLKIPQRTFHNGGRNSQTRAWHVLNFRPFWGPKSEKIRKSFSTQFIRTKDSHLDRAQNFSLVSPKCLIVMGTARTTSTNCRLRIFSSLSKQTNKRISSSNTTSAVSLLLYLPSFITLMMMDFEASLCELKARHMYSPESETLTFEIVILGLEPINSVVLDELDDFYNNIIWPFSMIYRFFHLTTIRGTQSKLLDAHNTPFEVH